MHTNSFTKEEVELLIRILKDNFNLEGTIRIRKNNQYVIYLSTNQIPKIRTLVKDYVHPSMLYKLK